MLPRPKLPRGKHIAEPAPPTEIVHYWESDWAEYLCSYAAGQTQAYWAQMGPLYDSTEAVTCDLCRRIIDVIKAAEVVNEVKLRSID